VLVFVLAISRNIRRRRDDLADEPVIRPTRICNVIHSRKASLHGNRAAQSGALLD
jgi:hypothetical protein